MTSITFLENEQTP